MHSDSFPRMCLNEYHLILLLAGAFVGLFHSLLGVIHNMNYVSFHAIQVCEDAEFFLPQWFSLRCCVLEVFFL